MVKKSTQEKSAFMVVLQDRPIAYYPIFAKACGGVTSAVMLSQLLYWSGKEAGNGGWIYKTQADMEAETGLTRREQETARRNLVACGVIETRLAGVPAKLHYRVDFEALAQLVQNVQTSLAENAKLDCTKRANLYGGKRQTNTETTQRIRKDYADENEISNEISFSENAKTAIVSPPVFPPTGEKPVEQKAPEPKPKKPEPEPERKPSPLTPDTAASRKLFGRVQQAARDNRRREPQRFATIEMKLKFDRAAEMLNGAFDELLEKALQQGIADVRGITNYMAKCAERESANQATADGRAANRIGW
jgi:hypothetical protein